MPFKYRADHVGSLLRPKEPVEDRHILNVLQRQNELGFKIFSDGELRRRGFMSDFYESIEGLDTDGSIARAWQGGKDPSGGLKGIVVGKIKQQKRLTKHEVD